MAATGSKQEFNNYYAEWVRGKIEKYSKEVENYKKMLAAIPETTFNPPEKLKKYFEE